MNAPKSHKIVKNAFSRYIRNLVNVAVFLFLTPYVAEKLGTEHFGLWSLLWSTVGLLALFDMGFSPAVVKYISEARGQQDQDRLNRLTATFFWVHVAMGVLAMLTACAITPFLGALLTFPPDLVRAAQIVFLLLSFRLSQSFPAGLFQSLMVSYQRETYANYIKTVGVILYGAMVIFIFKFSATVETIAWINVVNTILVNGTMAYVTIRKLPDVTLKPRYFEMKTVKEILGFSLFAVVLYISKLLYTRVDAIIIQLMSTLSKVAYYNVAAQTVERASSLTGLLNGVLAPIIAERSGAGDENAIRKLLLDGSKLSFALTIPLLAGFIWLSEPLMLAWMGEEFRETILPLQILIVSLISNKFADGPRNTLLLTGYHRFLTISSVIAQAVNLGLTVTLIRYIGLPGVALATLFSSVSLDMTYIFKGCSRYQLSIWQYLQSALFPSILPTAIMVGALWGMGKIFAPNSLILVAIYEAVACIIFLVAFFYLGLSKENRQTYVQRARNYIQRKRKK